MYDHTLVEYIMTSVTGPCKFLVMYDMDTYIKTERTVTGPCEFLVMYDHLL